MFMPILIFNSAGKLGVMFIYFRFEVPISSSFFMFGVFLFSCLVWLQSKISCMSIFLFSIILGVSVYLEVVLDIRTSDVVSVTVMN